MRVFNRNRNEISQYDSIAELLKKVARTNTLSLNEYAGMMKKVISVFKEDKSIEYEKRLRYAFESGMLHDFWNNLIKQLRQLTPNQISPKFIRNEHKMDQSIQNRIKLCVELSARYVSNKSSEATIRRNAQLLAQGVRSNKSSINRFPKELCEEIAALTANPTTHLHENALKIAQDELDQERLGIICTR